MVWEKGDLGTRGANPKPRDQVRSQVTERPIRGTEMGDGWPADST